MIDRRRLLIFVTLPLVVVALLLLAYAHYINQQNDKALAECQKGSTGTDFVMDGAPVSALLILDQSTVQVNNSFNASIAFQSAPSSSGLGALQDGDLTATLSADGCTNSSSDPPQRTTQELVSFVGHEPVWTWNVRCGSPGLVCVSASLTFHPNGQAESDAFNYHQNRGLWSTQPILQQVPGLLSVLASILALLTGAIGLARGFQAKT